MVTRCQSRSPTKPGNYADEVVYGLRATHPEKFSIGTSRMSRRSTLATDKVGDGDPGVPLINGVNNIARANVDLPNDFGIALFPCAKLMKQVSGASFWLPGGDG